MDAEVVEIPPSLPRSSKPLKQKEVSLRSLDHVVVYSKKKKREKRNSRDHYAVLFDHRFPDLDVIQLLTRD